MLQSKEVISITMLLSALRQTAILLQIILNVLRSVGLGIRHLFNP